MRWLLLFLLPSSGLADTIGTVTITRIADPGVIDACLDGFPDSPDACIGSAANHCDLMGGDGISACTVAETQLWEDWRLEAQQILIDAALARERANPTVGKGTLTFALQQMEQAWETYRDALCSHASLAFDDPASMDDAIACELQITAQKTFELRRLETLYQTR